MLKMAIIQFTIDMKLIELYNSLFEGLLIVRIK